MKKNSILDSWTKKLGKKGFIGDVAFTVVALFAVAIVILVVYNALTVLEPQLNQSPYNNSESFKHIHNVKTRFVGLTDMFGIIILVGLTMTSILLVVFLDTHPAFFWITLFILIFIAIIGGLLANTYNEIATSPTLNATSSEFTILPFIFQNYVAIIIGMGSLVLGALYIKGRGGDRQG